ncbi:MAG: fructosamine kinase family protein [Vicingaceae bacterium]
MTGIPKSVKAAVEKALLSRLGTSLAIQNSSVVGGGSINDAYHLSTDNGEFFLKLNSAKRYPEMFEREAEGLVALRNANSIEIPEVVLTGDNGDQAFIVIQYIEKGAPGPDFWNEFGRSLAHLHRHTNDRFGFEKDNYIGSLHQVNNRADTWPEFFVRERLEVMVKMAVDKGKLVRETIRQFDRLCAVIDDYFPEEPPALLHGDLWSGNYLCNDRGKPVIFDPAVYYGHREMDLGMSRLFGGFDREFYRVYDEQYPLEKGWEERLEVANLYPLLVHVNLFGGSYVYDVQRILKRVVG